MRIARGLFRLWVVASILWVLFVSVMTWQTWPLDEERSGMTSAPTNDPEFEAWKAKNRIAERRDALVKGAVIAFTPPVAVLLLGMSLMWVARGFRPEKP